MPRIRRGLGTIFPQRPLPIPSPQGFRKKHVPREKARNPFSEVVAPHCVELNDERISLIWIGGRLNWPQKRTVTIFGHSASERSFSL